MILVTFFDRAGSPEEMGKRKKKPGDRSRGCQLQRMSGRTFIRVEDAASPPRGGKS